MKYEKRSNKRIAKKMDVCKEYDDFDSVFTFAHMYESYKNCRKGVNWKSSTQSYKANATFHIVKTLKQLQEGKFRSKGFFEFDIFERGKLRHIQSVLFGERVVQRCLCDYSLTPMMSRTFIYDNGASLEGKGYTFSVNRIEEHLHRHYRKHGTNGYILLMDFSKFFENIPHDYVKQMVRRQYTDECLVSLIDYFIDQFDGDRGLGLGSQISQILALVAANELDHFIKESLKINGYGRYMDDSYLIHEDKKYLEYCLTQIKAKCKEYGIVLNDRKVRICKITQPFTYLKVRFFVTDSGRVVKRVYKNSVVRMRRKLKKFRGFVDSGYMTVDDVYQSYQSWKSHAEMLNSHHAIGNMANLYDSLYGNTKEECYVQGSLSGNDNRCD